MNLKISKQTDGKFLFITESIPYARRENIAVKEEISHFDCCRYVKMFLHMEKGYLSIAVKSCRLI